ncbi:MAG: alanine racemase [Ignavibacteria bacterium]|nr:alanine racemase [Ignavibacteria bacterium]
MNLKSDDKNFSDTFAEIDLKIFTNNFKKIREYARSKKRDTKICSIVKANAYGHGMNEMAETLSRLGTDYLGTADYTETASLRNYLDSKKLHKVPILCLGLITEKNELTQNLAGRNIEFSVADLRSAKMLNDVGKKLNRKPVIHIQVDTGINRTGIKTEDAYDTAAEISKLKNINVKGIYSHFATSEIPGNRYSELQLRKFKEVVKEIEESILKFELRHISNTGGILNFNDGYFNMVRPGISLYGFYPDEKKVKHRIGIEPVMSLKSKIKFIKELNKGESISYGRTFYTNRRTRIASIPAGYGDGYPRSLSNLSKIFINGKLYKVAGTVCMDWIMADIGMKDKININDEAELFGRNYPAHILAALTDTISYEITCNISSRVKRIYKK